MTNSPSNAQVIPDATLPNNTTVNINGSTINIEGGTRLGNNLFHSLKDFSVLTGNTVHFDNALDVLNIITRITGGSVSNIDSLISANGIANLFLINPSGIVFGSNARLGIGGSLFVTTADSLEFANGSEFSAVNPQKPLLTVDIPIGLRFNGNSGSITVQGTGEGLTRQGIARSPSVINNNSVGLQVLSGKTVALVANKVNIVGGTITAQESQNWGDININSTESLRLSGTSPSPNRRFFSTIRTESVGTAAGGNINVSTKDLVFEGGASIGSTTYSSVKGGNVNLNAFSINISSPLNSNLQGGIIVNTASSGNTGDINISTNNLAARDGGIITSLTFGAGNAGNISINTNNFVELTNSTELINSGTFFSYIASQAFSSGEAGSLIINAQRLVVGSKATINTSTYGLGNAGEVSVNASQIEVNGSVSSSAQRATPEIQRFFNSPPIPSGSPGQVLLNSNSLSITNGGQVAVVNEGTGNAGTLSIRANTISLVNQGAINATTTSGQGGDISLNSQNIRLDNGNVSATAGGTGNGGNIDIETQSLVLQNNSSITANAFEGRGGNVTIDTQGLFISSNSRVTASSERGIDGKVQINSAQQNFIEPNNLTVIEPPQIQSSCTDTGGLPDQLTITGKGGLPANPTDIISGTILWLDENTPANNTQLPQIESSEQADQHISAQGAITNPDGTISFTVTPENATISQPSLPPPCQFKTSEGSQDLAN